MMTENELFKKILSDVETTENVVIRAPLHDDNQYTRLLRGIDVIKIVQTLGEVKGMLTALIDRDTENKADE